jgi:hypothetical protein
MHQMKIYFWSSSGVIMVANGFGLGVRAGFGAQSFNLLLKFMRSTKLQVCTQHA